MDNKCHACNRPAAVDHQATPESPVLQVCWPCRASALLTIELGKHGYRIWVSAVDALYAGDSHIVDKRYNEIAAVVMLRRGPTGQKTAQLLGEAFQNAIATLKQDS